jgi:hypothetical protein
VESVIGRPVAEREPDGAGDRVVVEALDNHGRVQWREWVVLGAGCRAFTIGRSLEADVMLDDPYAAVLHVSIEVKPDGRLLAADLGSVNGIVVRGRRVGGSAAIELPDSTLQVGRTHLRVRTGREPLAPEKPDEPPVSALVRRPAEIAAFAAVVSILQVIYASWLGAPRDLTMTIVTALAYTGASAAVWVAFWGLLSRIMQGEWRWLRHTAIYLGVTSTLVALVEVVDLGGFLLSLPQPGNLYFWMGAIALALGLFLHLTHASHLAPVRAALVAGIIPVLLVAGVEWLQMRNQTRDVNHIGASLRIYPPGLRLVASEKLESYFAKAMALRELADKRLTEAVADEESETY